MDVVHLAELNQVPGGPRLAECGADAEDVKFVTANHRLVTCLPCERTDNWEALHNIRWAGEPCDCRRPKRTESPNPGSTP